MIDIVTILNCIVVLGIAVSAILAVSFDDLLSSIIALGATGLFAGLAFLLLHAPDVAISEVAVGAALTPLIFIVALRKVKGRDGK